MNRLTKMRYYLPVTLIGIMAVGLFGYMAFFQTPTEKQVENENGTYIVPRGIEALDLNVDAVKVIVANESKIPLLGENSDYAYDGFISVENETNLDVIFTLYDKTNSSLTKIPGIQHGPEFIQILDNFIIHVDTDKKLMVYARK